MKAAVLVYPGSNCDRDMAEALRGVGADVTMVWHKDDALPAGVDLVAVPGGFSFGDYLRCGAIAARAPITRALRDHADRGGYVLGVCNGFQVLTETGLLPGALIRNAGLTFICKSVGLKVHGGSVFTDGYHSDQISLPVAHHDGNYQVDNADALFDAGRVAFTYAEPVNGSAGDIAGVLSANKRVLGLMPHPERAVDAATGNTDGAALFAGLIGALTPA